ncbi:Clavaminate synthase-like protein [Sistotremastrum niveocremeum HHB9708]|uniref:Clavaminate synthase-like protein n=1 Tax=Sistotremastrum niveocremeum HHB9708 TaxID=1314777 RepID=A0A164V4Z1_9AGAM|nr:Clavaminate synthase-like protein [Sistotremastrum niveocremeum HHB9708]
MSFHAVPVIDFSRARSTDPDERLALVKNIKDACTNVGFFYAKNHGVDAALLQNVTKAMKSFFAHPLEGKQKWIREGVAGYTPIQKLRHDPNQYGGDMHEAFEIKWELLDPLADSSRDDGIMSATNVWPDEPPEFRLAALSYYHAVLKFGLSIFPLFALALGLPENFFDDKTTKPAAPMRLLHYPAQTGIVDDRTVGIGAHTDWQCFTLLWQDEVGGLQVLNQDNKWIDAPPIPGTFVVNIGDQLSRWTNDTFKSTVHRAINRTNVERFSIPIFFGSDYDVDIAPIATCVSEDRPAKYPSITAAEYVRSRWEAAHGIVASAKA